MQNQVALITVSAFVEAMQRGASAIQEAARILVQLVDQNPAVLDTIVTKHRDITIGMLRKLVKIGRGRLLPLCAFSDNPGDRALARLSIDDQRKYQTEPIELLISRNGSVDSLLVPVNELQRSQIKQVFASNHIRSLGEQRAWIESQRPTPIVSKTPFTIRRDRVLVHVPCVLSREDVLRMLFELHK